MFDILKDLNVIIFQIARSITVALTDVMQLHYSCYK